MENASSELFCTWTVANICGFALILHARRTVHSKLHIETCLKDSVDYSGQVSCYDG